VSGISPERQAEAFAMYRDGASERAVAVKLGCGNATAHRLRQRFLSQHNPAQEPPERIETAEADMTMTDPLVPDFDAELVELQRRRGELAEDVSTHEERAAASGSAVQQLEAERLETLASGHDAQPLRQRRRDAEDDLADSQTAAGFARGRLAAVDAEIRAVQERIADTQQRAELAEAISERDAICARTGDRMRAAALGTHASAVEFTAALADERDAVREVAELAARIALTGPAPHVPAPVSTLVSPHPDMTGSGAPLAWQRAISEALAGNVRAVSVRLAEVFGQIPPTPAELAAEAAGRQAAMAAANVHAPGPARPLADVPPGWDSEFGLDDQGRQLRPQRPAYQDQPGDSWRTPGVGGRPPLVPPVIPGAGWLGR
jgi:hypothetical protein